MTCFAETSVPPQIFLPFIKICHGSVFLIAFLPLKIAWKSALVEFGGSGCGIDRFWALSRPRVPCRENSSILWSPWTRFMLGSRSTVPHSIFSFTISSSSVFTTSVAASQIEQWSTPHSSQEVLYLLVKHHGPPWWKSGLRQKLWFQEPSGSGIAFRTFCQLTHSFPDFVFVFSPS